jgi:hypothetical protein
MRRQGRARRAAAERTFDTNVGMGIANHFATTS